MPHKVTKEQAREHERKSWELRQRGWTHERIAQELELDRSAVTKILSRVSDRVLAEMKDRVEQQKIEQTATLDHIKAEALAEWERSREPHRHRSKRTTRRAGETPGEALVDTSEVEDAGMEDRLGDVAYLAEARAALAEIRKIWGIDAPVKSEHPAGGVFIQIVSLEIVAPGALEDAAEAGRDHTRRQNALPPPPGSVPGLAE